MIISTTAVIHGRGSSRFKWVSDLTEQEREAVHRGELVLIRDHNSHPTTTDYKQVSYSYGRYVHRNYYGKVEEAIG